MTLDHKAIFKAYPSVVTIDDGRGAFDVNGNPVSLEQSNIDAARATLNTELSDVQYKNENEPKTNEMDKKMDQLLRRYSMILKRQVEDFGLAH